MQVGVDPYGLFGMFFGGTNEGKPGVPNEDQEWAGMPWDRFQECPGSIAQMSQEYADDGVGHYYEIEFISNLEARVTEAHEDACSYVCSKLKTLEECYYEFDDYVVDTFGWSRGAIGAHLVSERLNNIGCSCESPAPASGVMIVKPLEVRFVGMLDAVNNGGLVALPNPAQISPNAGLAVHEQRDLSEDGRDRNSRHFIRQDFSGAVVNPWSLTHGEVGRDQEPRDHLKAAAKGVGVKW